MSVAAPRGVSTLLVSLGGRDALEVIVAGFYRRLTADAHLATRLAHVAHARHEARLASFLAALLDQRPGAWAGRDLASAHADLGIDAEEFARFLDLLDATLAAAGIGGALRADIRAALARLADQIVTAPVGD